MSWFIKWLKQRNRLKSILLTCNKIGIHSYLISGDQFDEVRKSLEPGDAILIRAFLESTTILQQSKFTHTAMRSPMATRIIDATGEGVKKRNLSNLGVGINRICVRRPKLSQEKRKEIAFASEKYLNRPYDFSFSMGPDQIIVPNRLSRKQEEAIRHAKEAMYCSELYFWSYNDVNPGVLEMRERFGIMTFTSDDIYFADKHFETVIECRADRDG